MTAVSSAGIPGTFKGKPLRFSWIYRDAAGAELGHVVRYDDGVQKDVVPFFQQNAGQWTAGAGAEPRPLYGLDTLPDADVVYIVEGEKCSRALHNLGLSAVTSPGGARSAHHADWTPVGHVDRVVILPDHDEPGEAYARDVVGILSRLPGQREVVVCRLPDLPEHGDIVDWIQGRTAAPWDGFGPVPREPGDDLAAELLDVIREHAEPAPPEWTAAEPAVHDRDAAPPEWEAPVTLDAAQRPTWPRDVFPEPVQRFVDALEAATETPPELPAMMVLAVLATASQGKYRVRVDAGWTEPMCLWTCCPLPPGSRKSAVLDSAMGPMKTWERHERDALLPEVKRAESQRKTIQARIDSLRKKSGSAAGDAFDEIMQDIADLEADLPDVPVLPSLWTSDVTAEALALHMQSNHECMGILADESGIVDIIAGRYSAGVPNLDIFLSAHAGQSVRVNRASRDPVCLHRPNLSIGICPQPDVVRALADKPGFRGRGLLGRFLYAMPESNLGRRSGRTTPIPDDVAAAYDGIVLALLDRRWPVDDDGHVRPWDLCLSREAWGLLDRLKASVEPMLGPGGAFEHITDWAGKFTGAVARIAGIFHVVRYAHDEPERHDIGARDMAAAMRLGEVLQRHALLAFDAMGAAVVLDDARTLVDWVQRKGEPTFTLRDAHAAHKHRFPRVRDLDEPLAVLEERHFIRRMPQPVNRGAGRPSHVFEVNPAVLGMRRTCAA